MMVRGKYIDQLPKGERNLRFLSPLESLFFPSDAERSKLTSGNH